MWPFKETPEDKKKKLAREKLSSNNSTTPHPSIWAAIERIKEHKKQVAEALENARK